jgi:hypothetical protein
MPKVQQDGDTNSKKNDNISRDPHQKNNCRATNSSRDAINSKIMVARVLTSHTGKQRSSSKEDANQQQRNSSRDTAKAGKPTIMGSPTTASTPTIAGTTATTRTPAAAGMPANTTGTPAIEKTHSNSSKDAH